LTKCLAKNKKSPLPVIFHEHQMGVMSYGYWTSGNFKQQYKVKSHIAAKQAIRNVLICVYMVF